MIWIWPKTLNPIFQDSLLTAAGQHSAWPGRACFSPLLFPSLGLGLGNAHQLTAAGGRRRGLAGTGGPTCVSVVPAPTTGPQAGRGAVGQKDKNRDGAGAGLEWAGEAGSVGKACWTALTGRGLAPLRDQLAPLSIGESVNRQQSS